MTNVQFGGGCCGFYSAKSMASEPPHVHFGEGAGPAPGMLPGMPQPPQAQAPAAAGQLAFGKNRGWIG
ncbi:MAG: hypothetical protein VKJ04_03665 [Vampirovibrionales bacterium]|nr:hypothetical protein [Vampirovibrionales bacterium]